MPGDAFYGSRNVGFSEPRVYKGMYELIHLEGYTYGISHIVDKLY